MTTQPQASLDTLMAMLTEQGKKQEEQGRKFDSLQTEWAAFRNSMPDVYVPRREIDQSFKDVRERAASHETRLTAMEEWRLAETQRAAQAQIALQAQIQSAALAAVKDASATREKAMEGDSQMHAAVSQQRQELDGRAIAVWLALALAILSPLLTFALTHLSFRP